MTEKEEAEIRYGQARNELWRGLAGFCDYTLRIQLIDKFEKAVLAKAKLEEK